MPDLYFTAVTQHPNAIVDEEAFCLISSGSIRSERRGHTCQTLQKAVKKKIVKVEEHRVRSVAGSAVKKMVKVRVKRGTRHYLVLADIVTGSLYNLRTGECYTGKLFIDD